MGTCGGYTRRPSFTRGWMGLAVLGFVLSIFIQGIVCETEPTESQCRPYIEKALKEQHLEETTTEDLGNQNNLNDENEDLISDYGRKVDDNLDPLEEKTEESKENEADNDETNNVSNEAEEDKTEEQEPENEDEDSTVEDKDKDDNAEVDDSKEVTHSDERIDKKTEEEENRSEDQEGQSVEAVNEDNEEKYEAQDQLLSNNDDDGKDEEENDKEDDTLDVPIEIEVQEIVIDDDDNDNDNDNDDNVDEEKKKYEEKDDEKIKDKSAETDHDDDDKNAVEEKVQKEDESEEKEEKSEDEEDKSEEIMEDNKEDVTEEKVDTEEEKGAAEEKVDTEEEKNATEEEVDKGKEDDESGEHDIASKNDESVEDKDTETTYKTDFIDKAQRLSLEQVDKRQETKDRSQTSAESKGAESLNMEKMDEETAAPEEEELIQEVIIPENLRPRTHINQILKLDEDSKLEKVLEKAVDSTLKSLKNLYDNAIKPLEMLYKYRDLSNRHFGDPEIFSKPLILFMGPWSGGKSSTINYLLDNEYTHTSLRTGAEPSPAYFNILVHGEQEEILDGTQLAADWTFSGLQKFGQGLLDRLKGIKLPNKLLEKVNIVEIPGILEIRKQVQRLFPFNDACQWFIDRADIIFLVYDPSKLDVGPETEAILDQLKGREYQTRIILNKADQVKPEELMRVQGTLIWNISPLMSSTEPPVMYSTSLWSMPYESGAPTRLLLAQERAFLRDLREAIDKRVENKISSARRFAVRVRNHAKMVDCYLTTYYNHKSFFGNRKRISDDIIEYPQKYHIYEGLSTLTNISRYDLPDPDVYRDFFKINPLYDFQKLSETCTYFRGCPINKLDIAIAYDLPELVGKYRKSVEMAKEQLQKENR